MNFLKTKKNNSKQDENLQSKFSSLSTTNHQFIQHSTSFSKRKKLSAGTPTKKGFVLVETITAVALFSIIMTIAVVSLLNLVEANKRTQTFKIVVNNINLALESMSKEIRVGSNFTCSSNCDGSSSFKFTSRESKTIFYDLSAEGRIRTSSDGLTWYDITAPDIFVEDLRFYVRGEGPSDNQQPRVMIVVSGYSGKRHMDKTKFELQTTVSQRRIRD